MRPPHSTRSSVARLVALALGSVLLLSLLAQFVSVRLAARAERDQRGAKAGTLFLVRLSELRLAVEARGVTVRARLFDHSPAAVAEDQERRATVLRLLDDVEALSGDAGGRQLIARIRQGEASYTAGVERVLELPPAAEAEVLRAFQTRVPPLRTELSQAIDALLTSTLHHAEELLDRADQSAGRARDLSLTATLLALGIGALVALLLTREVDRRFALEERALRLRDEFLSAASHELKTPLAVLSLWMETLRRVLAAQGGPGPGEARAMEKMHAQVRRLAQLIESMLDVSRLDAGRLTVERQPTDLVALVRETAAEFEPQLAHAGVSLRLEASGPVMGEFDPLRLHLVVLNLLSNAVKYGRGSPVEVTVAHADGTALLRVEDKGPGIAPEDHERVFERFERASRDGGTGLGLWLVRELVRAHGGQVHLESAPGKGATFIVTLPLMAPAPGQG